MKWIRNFFLRTHINSLDKVIANCEKEGWLNCEIEARKKQNEFRSRLTD